MVDLASLYIKVDSKGVVTASKDLDKLTDTSRKTETATNSAAKAFEKLTSIMKGLAFAAVAASIAATTYVLKKSIEQFAAFEKELANVSTLVNTNIVSMAKFQKELFALDSNLGSTTELTKGLYQALSAGVKATKAVEFVGKAAMAAKAGLSDTFTAVDAGTTILNAFGISTDKATDIYDLMFTTVKEGKTTFAELASSVGRISPIASAAGVSVTEMHAALATLTKGGFATCEASARLATALGTIIKPSSEAQKLTEKLGLEFNATALRTKGLHGFLQDVAKATGGNVDQLALLFGGMESLSVMLALTGKQSQEFTDIFERMGDVSEATKEAFDKQKVTLTALWDTFKNTVGKQAIYLGEKLAPKIKEIIDKMSTWFDANKDIIEQNPQIIEDIGEFVKNVLDLATAMGKVIKLGVEFTNVWVKTWQALGLASTGIIDLKTAMLGGATAVDTFNEALGPEKLRLAFLERVIATGKYTSKVYWEAKRLRALIDALPDIDVAKTKDAVTDTGAAPVIDTVAVIGLTEEQIEAMQIQENFAIKMAEAEQCRQNERYELTKEINKKIHDELLSDTDLKLQELDAQYLNALSHVKDTTDLDAWYIKQHNEIVGTKEQAYMGLYARTGKLTQEAYDISYAQCVKERDNFIRLTGDKKTAQETFAADINALNESMIPPEPDLSPMLQAYMDLYNDMGILTQPVYDMMSEQYAADCDAFILATGNKELAYEIFVAKMKKLNADMGVSDEKTTQDKMKTAQDMSGMMASTFETLANLGGKHSEKMFKAFKVLKIAETLISSYSGAMKAYAEGGTYAGPAMAAIILAFGAAQVAAIQAQEPPSYDQGGVSHAGGLYQTGNIDEAHIPIPSGGKIPVQVSENKQTPRKPMEIHIHEASDTQTRVEESDDGMTLDIIIEQVEQKMAGRMNRGAGLASFMDNRYSRTY